MKTLYFEGAGWSQADISRATIGNCRVRTAFHTTDGRRIYLEISGTDRSKKSDRIYEGYIDHCFLITDDKPNDDENKHNLIRHRIVDGSLLITLHRRSNRSKPLSVGCSFPYDEEHILRIVNKLGCDVNKIKVVPDLGGYRVFKNRGTGYDRFNYGDEFVFDAEMTRRREAVYKFVYQEEKKEREEDWANKTNRFAHGPFRPSYPNFSIWVDHDDPGMLHLLRHYLGYNREWEVRTDMDGDVEDWMSAAKEI